MVRSSIGLFLFAPLVLLGACSQVPAPPLAASDGCSESYGLSERDGWVLERRCAEGSAGTGVFVRGKITRAVLEIGFSQMPGVVAAVSSGDSWFSSFSSAPNKTSPRSPTPILPD